MVWNKPRNIWQWLLLLLPAVAAIIAAQTAEWWMPPIPPLRYPNGLVITNVAAHIVRVSSIALEVTMVGSGIIALILSHGPQLAQRITNALFLMLCLFFVNSFVAFGGCALAGTPKSGPYVLAPARADTADGKSPAAQ
jgi:hypothetical protein